MDPYPAKVDMRGKANTALKKEPSGRAYRLRLGRYKEAARTYRDFIDSQSGANRTLRLLDVGVGRARLRQCLDGDDTLGDRLAWTGVDNDEAKLEAVQDSHRWQLHCVDVRQGLSFPDDTFDMVFCEQLLEHLADPKPVVVEIVRVLRPGGMFIGGAPSFVPGVALLRSQCVALAQRFGLYAGGHRQTFTKRSFLKLCADAGLTVRTVRGFRIFSGDPLAFLENRESWYRFNVWLGRKLPGLCIEVQVVANKPDRTGMVTA